MSPHANTAPISRRSLGRMTYEEFLEWDGETQHVEWVDGEVIEMAPVSDAHQDLVGFLYALLRAFVETHELGRVLFDPFQMKTGPRLPSRAPDILFVAKNNLSRLEKNRLIGPADLVVEVISPGSGATDRGQKFDEYEKGGVCEYWLLDPHCGLGHFFKNVDGVFRQQESVQGVFSSNVLKGFEFDLRWVSDPMLPTIAAALRQLGLV